MNKQDTEEDRISTLPDDIICSILSNLYVEESTRTSILSKRWHNMWLHSPITICDESIVKQSCIYCFAQDESSSWIVNVISHIISTHSGPIHTCNFILPDWDKYKKALVNLLKALILKDIQNLQVNIETFEIPLFVFECASLVNVCLHGGPGPTQLPAHKNIFPNLRKLTLKGYDMNNDFLVNLFSSTSIIHLALFKCHGLDDVVIESDSLHKFVFKDINPWVDVGLTITNVRNLESFECDGLPSGAKVVISNAPKLKVLSCIGFDIRWLQLGNCRFNYGKHVKIGGEITCMPALRFLETEIDFNSGWQIKSVPRILMCLPCLETLEVRMTLSSITYYRDDEYFGQSKNKGSVSGAAETVADDDYDDYVHLMSNLDCFNHHLKNVRISYYLARQVNLDFVRLIVANAKVLETLTIGYGRDFEERWIKAQKHFLMQNRASKMLRVEFVKEKIVWS